MDMKKRFVKLFASDIEDFEEDNGVSFEEFVKDEHPLSYGTAYETEDGKYGVFVEQDVDARDFNPRTWGNSWKWNVGIRGRLELDEFNGDESVALEVPIYAYVHGGVVLSLGEFSDQFDSGQAGVAYLTEETFKEEFNSDKEKAMERLEAEISSMNMFLGGNVYSVTVYTHENDTWEWEDSISGIYADSEEEAAKYMLEEYHGVPSPSFQ